MKLQSFKGTILVGNAIKKEKIGEQKRNNLPWCYCSDGEMALKEMLKVEKFDNDLTLKFSDGSRIVRKKTTSRIVNGINKAYNPITFYPKSGKEIVLDSPDDFQKLMEGAKDDSLVDRNGFDLIDNAEGFEGMLDKAVSNYYGSKYDFDDDTSVGSGKEDYMGNPKASNTRGSGQFRFSNTQQFLGSQNQRDLREMLMKVQNRYEDSLSNRDEFDPNGWKSVITREELGLFKERFPRVSVDSIKWNTGYMGFWSYPSTECEATTMLTQMKSLGLIPPDLKREEIERKYTWLHGPPEKGSIGTIPNKPDYVPTLRYSSGTMNNINRKRIEVGKKPLPKVTNRKVREDLAGFLKKSDWAKLTGMSSKSLTTEVVSKANLKNEIKSGKTAYIFAGGHTKMVSGYYEKDPENPSLDTYKKDDVLSGGSSEWKSLDDVTSRAIEITTFIVQ